MVQNYTYRYRSPSTQPPLEITTKVDQEVSMAGGQAPKGYPVGSNQIVRIRERDETKLSTNSSTTVAYVASEPSEDLLYASSTQIDGAAGAQSSTSTTKYASPRVVSRSGAAEWSNSPARTIDETFSDGHREDRTVAGDGTYVERGTAVDYAGLLAPTTLRDMSTGVGFYAGPFLACPPDTAFEFSAPSGTPPRILLTTKSSATSCGLTPFRFPASFVGNPTFYTESDTSKQTTVPSSCGTPKQHANDVRSTTIFLDTVIGYVERSQSDVYTAPQGTVCVVYSDTMLIYYDWQGDTPATLYLSTNAKPIASVVTQETLVVPNRGAALPAIAVGVLERHFVASLEPQRERLRSAMIRQLTNVQGGVR